MVIEAQLDFFTTAKDGVISADLLDHYEHPFGESLTIPDRALPVRKILELSKRGLDPGVNINTPIYHHDENGDPVLLPDVRHMDLAERQQLLEEAKQRVADIRAELNRLELAAQKEKADALAKATAEKAAHQGSPVQRTTGDGGHSITTAEPGQGGALPIS